MPRGFQHPPNPRPQLPHHPQNHPQNQRRHPNQHPHEHPDAHYNNHNNHNVRQQSKRGGTRRNTNQKKGSNNYMPNANSYASSSPSQPQQGVSLEGMLRNMGSFDYANEARRRSSLELLERILFHWSNDMLRDASTKNQWKVPRPVVITFGSYSLGVHRPSSDLDVLALCPPHCTRADFFLALVDRLKHDLRVAEVHPIPSAYTPVIKFVLQGVQIDLLFARLQNATKLFRFLESQPPLLLRGEPESMIAPNEPVPMGRSRMEYSIDDLDLQGVDEAGVRSLNGARVSQFMLSLVPNVETFRLTLRAVKCWSDIHGVQSNVLGFFGGINWAILVARAAVDNPKATAPQLLLIFFQTYSRWEWPKPVTLGPICTEPPTGVMPMPAWNPKVNPRDGLHLCPILTPVYPTMNSSYNIGIPQLRRIQDEMCRAAISLENARHPDDCSSIFQDGGFFHRHHHYLQVSIRARNAEDFLHWFRLCESRLRLLISCLETPEVQAWPFAKFFDRHYGTTHESHFFTALRFAQGVETVDLRYCTSEFLHKINSWEGRKEGMDLSISCVPAHDLPNFVVGRARKNQPQHRNNQPHQQQRQQQRSGRPTIDVALCPQMVSEGTGSPSKRAKLQS